MVGGFEGGNVFVLDGVVVCGIMFVCYGQCG